MHMQLNMLCTDQCQVLISTSTLAWGVNFPAHLAGLTEFPKGSEVPTKAQSSKDRLINKVID